MASTRTTILCELQPSDKSMRHPRPTCQCPQTVRKTFPTLTIPVQGFRCTCSERFVFHRNTPMQSCVGLGEGMSHSHYSADKNPYVQTHLKTQYLLKPPPSSSRLDLPKALQLRGQRTGFSTQPITLFTGFFSNLFQGLTKN